MQASVVIGANYGDEGKGLMTDYLAVKHGADLVIRFNGGAQAGHTVVTPEGNRHIFSHFGSGTFAGVPTYLSKYFIINPILFVKEFSEITKFNPKVFADPRCMVSTPWDMIWNQFLEEYRSEGRHGSCGVGIGTTTDRYEYGRMPSFNWNAMITMYNDSNLYSKLIEYLHDVYIEYLNKFNAYYSVKTDNIAEVLDKYKVIFDRFEPITEQYLKDFKVTKNIIETTVLPQTEYAVFEGAQGLALDQCMGHFPHVTRSNTGMRNVIDCCREFFINLDEIIYVSRTYITRHGAGPFDEEFPELPDGISDDTNIENSWQGAIRFGEIDFLPMSTRIILDAKSNGLSRKDWNMAVTHADQFTDYDILDYYPSVKYISYGPTRQHVTNHGF